MIVRFAKKVTLEDLACFGAALMALGIGLMAQIPLGILMGAAGITGVMAWIIWRAR